MSFCLTTSSSLGLHHGGAEGTRDQEIIIPRGRPKLTAIHETAMEIFLPGQDLWTYQLTEVHFQHLFLLKGQNWKLIVDNGPRPSKIVPYRSPEKKGNVAILS